MNNFYLIDKPLGISSFDVIRKLRKKLGIKKMGHTGTLDPLATGCLLIATGNYTKLIPYLEKAKKSYITTITLDGTTESFDLGEEVIHISEAVFLEAKKNISKKSLESILQNTFFGEIEQTPPKFSAVKLNGKRAYELAREGKEVNIASKQVCIHDVTILEYSYPNLILELEVSAGTYIRSIARDLGNILGTGGYLTKLQRTKIEGLDILDSHDLESVELQDYLDVRKLFGEKYFICKDTGKESYGNGMLSGEDMKRLENGLARIRKFDLKMNMPYFLYDGITVIYVVEYDGVELKPVRKI